MKLHELFEGTNFKDVFKGTNSTSDTFKGNLSCSYDNLTSLEGSPTTVSGNFFCSNNKLKSLKGAPASVGGDFYCFSNFLTSLEGAPSFVGQDFNCSKNKLTALKSAPEKVYNFNCGSNELSSFEGAPTKVAGRFLCNDNLFKTLHNIHKHIKQINGYANFNNNPIKSHVLGLLLISGLQMAVFDNKKVTEIINKHLAADRDVFACQEELIEAGLEEFAQL